MLRRNVYLIATGSLLSVVTVVAWPQSPAKPPLKTAVFDWNKIEAQPTKTGSKRQFFDGSTATLEELECHASTVNAGEANHAPVAQPHDELIIVKEGTLEAQVDGHAQHLDAGSILFQAAGDLHGVKNVGQTAATYYVIKIVPTASKANTK